MALSDIECFIIVLLENRSFDHVSGYLSLPTTTGSMAVDGFSGVAARQPDYTNLHGGNSFCVHPLDQKTWIEDPPHDLRSIATQINTPRPPGALPQMGGFVASHPKIDDKRLSPAMGHYAAGEVPIFDFFARKFVICDQWFSSLPTGTQPNRLMAMSGRSEIADNVSLFDFPRQELVYDWLNQNGVSWCSYTCGLPFFSLMRGWRVGPFFSLTGRRGHTRFRRFSKFREQWSSGRGLPQVIFIEPRYTDDPVSPKVEVVFGQISRTEPNDDHPPTNITAGQDFLSNIYQTLISNSDRWKRTLMIVTYDEHGGFFDHVPPLPQWTSAGGHDFVTSGVRVPAFIVSPHVAPGTVFKGRLEHTSILQLLAQRFTPTRDYSPAVRERLATSYTPLVEVIVDPPPQPGILALPEGVVDRLRSSNAGAERHPATGLTDTAEAFRELAIQLAIQYPSLLVGPYWHPVAQYVLDVADNRRPIPAYPALRVRPGAIRMRQLVDHAAIRVRSQLRRPGSAMANIRQYRAQTRSLAERLRLRFI